jgi:hypothetical protein
MDLVSDFTKDEDCEILNMKYINIETLENLEENDIKKINFLFEWGLVDNLEEALERYDEIYMYENQTMREVAYNYIQECYGSSINNFHSLITNNINYEGVAHDLQQGGDYYKVGSDILNITIKYKFFPWTYISLSI